jgi:hypothetical protein
MILEAVAPPRPRRAVMTAQPNPRLELFEIRTQCANCGHEIYAYMHQQTGELLPVEDENPWRHSRTLERPCPSPLAQLIGEPIEELLPMETDQTAVMPTVQTDDTIIKIIPTIPTRDNDVTVITTKEP